MSQPEICSGDQSFRSFPATTTRRRSLIASQHLLGRRARFEVCSSAFWARYLLRPPLRFTSRHTVEAGKAPMKVNSGAKVADLNADKLDGMGAGQLQGFHTLRVTSTDVTTLASTGNRNGFGTASCQAGEQAISGGVELRSGQLDHIFYSQPGGVPTVDPTTGQITGWKSSWFTDVDSLVRIYAVCVS